MFYIIGTIKMVSFAAMAAASFMALVYLPELRILARIAAGLSPAGEGIEARSIPDTPNLGGTPAEFITIILTAVTVVLAALAIVLALAALVGYVQIKNAAEAAATATAREISARVAEDVATPVATRVAEAAVAALEGGNSKDGDAIAGAQDQGGRNAGGG
jgi:hypothetical protein